MSWRYFVHNDTGDAKPKVTRALIMRVLGYAKPYRVHIGLILLILVLQRLVTAANPYLFRLLIDDALGKRDVALLDRLAFGLIMLPIMDWIMDIFRRLLAAKIGEGLIYDLRVSVFTHLQRMSLRFFTNSKTGELMSRLNNDVVGAQRAINSTLIGIITNIMIVVITLAIMLTVEWRLTLLALLVVPLFLLPARRLGNYLRTITREQMDLNAVMNATMNETLNVSGALLVKLFGRTRNEVERFEDRAGKVRDIGVKTAVINNQLWLLLSFIGIGGTALVYWVGGHLVIDGVFTIGLIVMFAAYLGQLYGPLQALANAPVDFATSMVSFERVFEVLDLPLEIDEKPDAIALKNVRGAVAFEDVSFSYIENDNKSKLSEVERAGRMDNVRAVLSGDAPRRDKNHQNGKVEKADPVETMTQARTMAINNISFSLQPGQLAALVGPSGAGKTTMTYLLPRLYDPTAGRILIDGHDLRDLTLTSLADAIGVVTQETYLFHDTIKTNLLYARPDATNAEIEAACRAANIHDFIAALPDKYETVVGERGYRLSGGEKQRVAIARVILKDPSILVLDEATSHLDSQSETLIQAALERVMQGRTSLVIAHRLSTIHAADVILVMDRGRIVEQGKHAELIAHNGLYAALYETQFSAMAITDAPN